MSNTSLKLYDVYEIAVVFFILEITMKKFKDVSSLTQNYTAHELQVYKTLELYS